MGLSWDFVQEGTTVTQLCALLPPQRCDVVFQLIQSSHVPRLNTGLNCLFASQKWVCCWAFVNLVNFTRFFCGEWRLWRWHHISNYVTFPPNSKSYSEWCWLFPIRYHCLLSTEELGKEEKTSLGLLGRRWHRDEGRREFTGCHGLPWEGPQGPLCLSCVLWGSSRQKGCCGGGGVWPLGTRPSSLRPPDSAKSGIMWLCWGESGRVL